MKKFLVTIGIILGVLVVLNFAMEPVAEHYANKALADLEGYHGELQDIDIHLWRGAYQIDSLVIQKVEDDTTTPFFEVSTIDLSVEWNALFNGRVVAEVKLEDPSLNFVVVEDSVQTGGDNNFAEILDELVPIEINRFEIENGAIRYVDNYSSPAVNVGAHNLNLVVTNLSNVQQENDTLPSSLDLSAQTTGNGQLNMNGRMNILKETPDVNLQGELENLDLTALNELTNSMASFTFEEGQMYLGTEFQMNDGHFEGRIKPILENVRVIDLDNEDTGFWRKVWEVVIGTTFEAFENQPKDRFATEVPFEGDIEANSEVGILPTIFNVLRNAFVEAFEKNIQTESGGTGSDDSQSGEEEEEDDGFLGIF